MTGSISQKIEQALGSKIVHAKPLSGGDIADVSCLTLDDGRRIVVKRPRMDQPDTTASEKMMLKHLAAKSSLPVPKVLFQTKGVLVLSHIEHQGITDAGRAAEDVAHHIAALHCVLHKNDKPMYGFEKDTFIGPLPQQNRPLDNWVTFFTERRLLAMTTSCVRTQRMPKEMMVKIERLANRLPDLIPRTPPSSLLHGDLWAGNMLIDGTVVASFIDPAISYGHNEMDLAFIALMGGLHNTFFDAYAELKPIEDGFFEERLLIYQLWPLLVHVRIFGGGYVKQVEDILDRFM